MAKNSSGYKPKKVRQTRTRVEILQPTYTTYHGVRGATYSSTGVSMANWASYGGTAAVDYGVLSLIDTAQVTMRYRPDIMEGT